LRSINQGVKDKKKSRKSADLGDVCNNMKLQTREPKLKCPSSELEVEVSNLVRENNELVP